MNTDPEPADAGEARNRQRLIRFAWFRILGATASYVFLVFLLLVPFKDGLPGDPFGYFWVAFYIAIGCFNYAMALRDRVRAGRHLGDDLPLIAGLVVVVVATAVSVVTIVG